jgi:hypothetical protein
MFLFTAYSVKDNRPSLAKRGVPRLVLSRDLLINGYTRMTPQAGMQIFMPDLDLAKSKKTRQDVNIEWMKNRNISPPPECDVPVAGLAV